MAHVDNGPAGGQQDQAEASGAQRGANGGHEGDGNERPIRGKEESRDADEIKDASPRPLQEDDEEDNKDNHRHNPHWHPHPSLHKPLAWLQKWIPIPLDLAWLKVRSWDSPNGKCL